MLIYVHFFNCVFHILNNNIFILVTKEEREKLKKLQKKRKRKTKFKQQFENITRTIITNTAAAVTYL
jgi:adenylate kinase